MNWNAKNLALLFPAGPTIAQMADIRTCGWNVSYGVPAAGGFRRARDGGGYAADVTPSKVVIQVAQGDPASHAMVAWK